MNTDESKLKAALIRKRRIELNWKQEAFAKSLPMANSSFSEMERGMRPITEELYKTIANKLKLPTLTTEWLKQQRFLMDLIKEKLYFCDYKEACSLYKELQFQDELLNNSILFLEYNLTSFIYNVTFSNNKETKKVKYLNKYIDCLDNTQIYQFILYQGILEKNLHHPSKALDYFQILFDIPYSINHFVDLLYYQTAICLIQIGHLALAHKYKIKLRIFLKRMTTLNVWRFHKCMRL